MSPPVDETAPLPPRRWLLPLLGTALVASRLPLFGDYLFGTDAVHLALALERFDLAAHSPHPPGYLFYVLLARLLASLGLAPNHAYLALSVAASLAGLALVVAIARRELGEDAAAIAGVLWCANPIVWFYGIVAESYAAEAACSALVGLLALRTLEPSARPGLRLLLLSLVVGLAGGVRSSVTVFCLPLWLYVLVRTPLPIRTRALAPAALAVGVAAWLVPTAWLTGGLGPYLELSRALIVENVGQLSSPLLGARRAFVIANLTRCAYWAAALVDFAGIIALFSWLLARRRNPSSRLTPGFTLLWVAPALLYFLLMYASKPGYFLVIAPPVLLLAARGLDAGLARLPTATGPRPTRLPLALLLVLLAAVNLWLFLVPIPALGRPSAMEVAYHDLLVASHLDGFRKLCADRVGRCAALYHLPPIAWRTGCVHAPTIDAYEVQTPQTQPSRPPGTSHCVCRAGRVSCDPAAIIPHDHELRSTTELWLDAKVDRLLLLVEERSRLFQRLAAAAPIRRLRAARGLELRHLELDGRLPLRLDGLTIRRAPPGVDPLSRGGLRHSRQAVRGGL